MLQNAAYDNMITTAATGRTSMRCAKSVTVIKASTKTTTIKRKWPMP